MTEERRKYSIALQFTKDQEGDLIPGVCIGGIAKRLITAMVGIDPYDEYDEGDLRYETDDAEVFAILLKLAYIIAKGGWFSIEPMPPGIGVFHLPSRRGRLDEE
jgi:hypothetical protein